MISGILFLTIILGLALLVALAVAKNALFVVNQGEVIIVERFGKFDRILKPGIHFLIPFFERPRDICWTFIRSNAQGKSTVSTVFLNRIDMRESVYDFPRQNVITKDNVTMEINALLYYQITDPKAAVYEVANLPEAIEKLTQTTLRNIIGHLDLDETLVSRDGINEKLRIILDDATDKWGVKVNRVELQEVTPPLDIREAMEKQMRAERSRRAAILEAEGKKSSAILESEGIKESSVLRAQGEAESRMIQANGEATARVTMAKAEAEAIEHIRVAGQGSDPLAYLIAMQYIKSLPEITSGSDNKLIIVPYESSAMMGSLASIKKLFNETK